MVGFSAIIRNFGVFWHPCGFRSMGNLVEVLVTFAVVLISFLALGKLRAKVLKSLTFTPLKRPIIYRLWMLNFCVVVIILILIILVVKL